MATQTPPLPQPALPPPLPPMRTSSGPDVKDAQTTLYGVNAAVASSRGANGGLFNTSYQPNAVSDLLGLRRALCAVSACL